MIDEEEKIVAWESNQPVVVPIDFSGQSVDAVQTAIKLAARPELVHVLHVVPSLDQIIPDVNADWQLPSDEERRTAVRRHFSEFLSEHGFDEVHEVVLDGKPGTEIADYAASVAAGVIVIPSHGYHGLKRMLLGSVAESVVRHANCPVFVLRRKDAE